MSLIDYIKNITRPKRRTVFNESYEEFYNKTKKSYDEYIESFYEHKEIYRRFNFKVEDESYETQIQDLYETLLSSSSNKYFIDCFRQKFRSDFVRAYIPTYIDDLKVDGYVKLKVKKSFDEESDRFKSFLNVHNYYIVKIDEEIAYKIIYVERYIQDNYTNEVSAFTAVLPVGSLYANSPVFMQLCLKTHIFVFSNLIFFFICIIIPQYDNKRKRILHF